MTRVNNRIPMQHKPIFRNVHSSFLLQSRNIEVDFPVLGEDLPFRVDYEMSLPIMVFLRRVLFREAAE
jgi:hypothetical protein